MSCPICKGVEIISAGPAYAPTETRCYSCGIVIWRKPKESIVARDEPHREQIVKKTEEQMKKLICNHYSPHDLIEIEKRIWQVIACCYGGVVQESVIGLVAHDQTLSPNNDQGKTLLSMYIPVKMLDTLINNGLAKHYGLRAQEVSEAA